MPVASESQQIWAAKGQQDIYSTSDGPLLGPPCLESPDIEFVPKRSSALQLSLAPAKKERGTVQEWRSNHHEPIDHSRLLDSLDCVPQQMGSQRGTQRTDAMYSRRAWVSCVVLLFNFLSDNKHPVPRSILPAHCCAPHRAYFVVSITLFREIIVCAHTSVKIIYSLFFRSPNETIKGHNLKKKKGLSLTFTVKACWEKLQFCKSKVWSPRTEAVKLEKMWQRGYKSVIPVYSMNWGQNAPSHVQTTFRMAHFSKNATRFASWLPGEAETRSVPRHLTSLSEP